MLIIVTEYSIPIQQTVPLSSETSEKEYRRLLVWYILPGTNHGVFWPQHADQLKSPPSTPSEIDRC
jgi:hypothetical protein